MIEKGTDAPPTMPPTKHYYDNVDIEGYFFFVAGSYFFKFSIVWGRLALIVIYV